MPANSAPPVTYEQHHHAHAQGLCAFVDASPSPFHVAARVARELTAAGFRLLDERAAWPREPGRYVVTRGGSVVAWSTPVSRTPSMPFRIVAGHTDSPNLRVKQHPDLSRAGWQIVGLEAYGGALLNSWLDRELGLSGRVTVRDPTADGGWREELVGIDEPLLRVPQLAIHLAEDRTGVQLDPQRHLDAVWGIGSAPHSFHEFVAQWLDADPADVLGWELMTHDLAPSRVFGRAADLISAPRLDNQGTCYAGTQALLAAAQAQESGAEEDTSVVPVLVLFDHEEVGSMSERGAFSDLLAGVLERVVVCAGGGREDFRRAVAGSICVSGDMAHATHPHHPERHEPSHRIQVGGGPVLKVHQNLRYATNAVGTAAFVLACDQAGVPLQRYMHRADLACGSTIGPITSSRVGIQTVDVGAPQLAMHSAREMMGAVDVALYTDALAAFLTPLPP
ncbi:M18 family aminopeptidase [soil metagenome]